jgi:hypothetical protein
MGIGMRSRLFEPFEPGKTEAGTWPPHRRLRLGESSLGAASTSRTLGWLSWLLGAVGLAMSLQARAAYAFWPLLGLVLPGIRLLVSPSYRVRLGRACRVHWENVRAYSAGAGPVPWTAATVFVALPVFLFDISNGQIKGAVDTRPVIPTAVSLVREGDWDISEFYRLDRVDILFDRKGCRHKCYQQTARGIYSAFPAGMVLFAAPVTGLARICGADLDRPWVHLRLQKMTAALVMALVLSLFFLVACCLGLPVESAVMTALLAVSSALYTTVGLGLWQHGGITFWLLVCLLIELRCGGRPGSRGILAQGIACAGLLTCRPTAVLLVAGFGTWVLLRSPRRAFLLAAIAALAYSPCVAMYWWQYGNIFGPATINGNMSGEYWHFGRLSTMAGVLICPARGLFVYQPWAVLAILVCHPAIRARARTLGYRAAPSGWTAFCLAVITAHWLLISAWHDWSGGDCWGSRMMTDIIPLLGLICVPAIAPLWRSRRSRGLILALGVLGALTHLPCAYLGSAAWNYDASCSSNLWSWPHAPFLYW